MTVLRKMMSVIMVLVLCLGLTACVKHNVRKKNPDGTVTRIEYKSAVPLQRAPYFELSGTTVKMSFNGTVWYEASVIDSKTKDWVAGGELLGESSNIKVYRASLHAEYAFAYVLTLDGTSDSYILFYTDNEPTVHAYGNDFTTSIRYFVDKTETVPDLLFK